MIYLFLESIIEVLFPNNLELTSFLLFVTGKLTVMKKKSILVQFIDDDEGTITAHTCGSQIVFPRAVFSSYNMFVMAMKAVIGVDASTACFNTV